MRTEAVDQGWRGRMSRATMVEVKSYFTALQMSLALD